MKDEVKFKLIVDVIDFRDFLLLDEWKIIKMRFIEEIFDNGLFVKFEIFLER